jgi:hypothetical protein
VVVIDGVYYQAYLYGGQMVIWWPLLNNTAADGEVTMHRPNGHKLHTWVLGRPHGGAFVEPSLRQPAPAGLTLAELIGALEQELRFRSVGVFESGMRKSN